LLTPTANLGSNGGSQDPSKRRAGGHGPTLDDQVSSLLPTVTAKDADSTSGSNPAWGHGTTLTDAVREMADPLLPSPMAADGERGSLTFKRGNPTLRGAVLGMAD
jgi:hypothetical protein